MKKLIIATCLTAAIAAPLCFASGLIKWVAFNVDVTAPAGSSLSLNGSPLNSGASISPADLVGKPAVLDVNLKKGTDLTKGANFDATLRYPNGSTASVTLRIKEA